MSDGGRSVLVVCKDHPEVLEEIRHFIVELDQNIKYQLRLYVLQLEFLVLVSELRNIKIEAYCPKLHHSELDLVMAIGGDGTVLHSAWQFQRTPVPPILPVFLKGTIGFLTTWNVSSCYSLLKDYNFQLSSISNRSRLCCTIMPSSTSSMPCSVTSSCGTKALAPSKPPQKAPPTTTFHVLNELSVDKGSYGGLLRLKLRTSDCSLLTSISADGIIIATPTGSTAYSMSAGGPIMHPNVNAILVTPICAYSLSFRPLVLPLDETLCVSLAESCRSDTAWVSFDGRERVVLKKGETIQISVSKWPVPLVTAPVNETPPSATQTTEWFASLSARLHWNDSYARAN